MSVTTVKMEKTSLDGVMVLTPILREDDRGWFYESWNAGALADLGLTYDFVQDNHSLSRHSGTVRGMHFQRAPYAQAKLVRCLRGAVYDAAVDVRRGSPTYGQWAGAVLSAENRAQLLIPRGFLHGFLTLVDDTEIAYKCDGPYDYASEGAVRWDSCGIDWPAVDGVHLKDSDRDAVTLAEFDSPFDYDGPLDAGDQ